MKFSLLVCCIFILNFNNSFSNSGWFQLNSGTNYDIVRMSFVNINVGWIGLKDHQVKKTTNGGVNWFNQSASFAGYGDLMFIDSLTGWVVGQVNSYRTTNGGNNWTSVGGQHLWCVYFISSFIGWGCGPSSSGPGRMFKTINGGVTWSQENDAVSGNAIHFEDMYTGWAASTNVIKTTNGGANWYEQPTGLSSNMWSIFFVSAQTGWLVGDGGSIIKTTDGGNLWIPQNSGISNTLNSVFFRNSSLGWVCGNAGQILKTTDGGNNWINQPSSVTVDLNSISFQSDLIGYVVGDSGKVLKTTNGGISINIKRINELIPDNYILEQNYPNPFNPSTNIRYEIPKTGFVKLVIFNVLGREIETLVNEKQTAGTYETTFNASQYPSGVYFYRLTTDNFSDTKKMLMIK